MNKICLLTAFLAMSNAFAGSDCESFGQKDQLACVETNLREDDARINATYKTVMEKLSPEQQKSLRNQQRIWIKSRDKACHLNTKVSDREKWFKEVLKNPAVASCVIRYTNIREKELSTMIESKAKISEDKNQYAKVESDEDFRYRHAEGRQTGKWYFEIEFNLSDLAKTIGYGQILAGVQSKQELIGVYLQVKKAMSDNEKLKKVIMGVALDLDNGKFFYHGNGKWIFLPGSAEGLDIKLGREYVPVVTVPVLWKDVASLIQFNFGKKKFAHQVPPGYMSFERLE